MIRRRSQAAALLTGAALLTAAGCGSDDEREGEPIPRAAATQIEQRLDEVQRRFDAATEQGKVGACQDIENDSYPAIDRVVADLPQNVDADVRDALRASIERLRDLTRDGCSNAEDTTTTEEEPAPAPPEPEPPVTREQPPPPQTNTQTQPEETQPEEPDRQGGNGNGNGRGPAGQGPPGQGGGGQPAPAPGGDG